MRKTTLAGLLARRVDEIHLAPFEQGEIGTDLFRHACLMGLKRLVSKTATASTAPPIRSLDQGEEPRAPCVRPGRGPTLVVAWRRLIDKFDARRISASP